MTDSGEQGLHKDNSQHKLLAEADASNLKWFKCIQGHLGDTS